MSNLSAEEIVEGIKRDKWTLKSLAVEIAKDPEMQSVMTKTALESIATKEDANKLRKETKEEINKLREELVHYVDKCLERLQWMVGTSFKILAIITPLTRLL